MTKCSAVYDTLYYPNNFVISPEKIISVINIESEFYNKIHELEMEFAPRFDSLYSKVYFKFLKYILNFLIYFRFYGFFQFLYFELI